MTSIQDIAYLRLHFAEPVPKDFLCRMCHELMTDPSTTNCCGHYFCYECINRIKDIGRTCPKCKRGSFTVQQDSQLKKKIESLKVYCPSSSKRGAHGCRWVGPMGEVHAHLNMNQIEGKCKFVHVKCPLGCRTSVLRGELEIHTGNSCSQRQFECIYCGFQDLYEKITLEHYRECLEHPVGCPNHCHMPGIRRHQLEDHLSLECPLRIIPCEFQHAGCDARLIYKDLAAHLKEDMEKHLNLVSLKCKALEESRAELEQKCSQIEGICVTLQRDMLQVSADLTELKAEVKKSTSRSRLASAPTTS